MRFFCAALSLIVGFLTVSSVMLTAEDGTKLQIDLQDGSRLIGPTKIKTLGFDIGFDELRIPLHQIYRLDRVDEQDEAPTYRVQLSNNDVITGDLLENDIPVKTVFGDVALAERFIRAIEFINVDDLSRLPVTRGLLVHYSFDNARDGLAVNEAGKNHNGTAANVTRVGKRTGRMAIRVNKRSSIQVPHSDDLCPETLTIGGWMFFDTPASGYEMIASKTNPSSWYGGYGFYRSSGDTVYFFVNNYSSSVLRAQVACNSWNHLLATYGDGQMKLYLNGVLVQATKIQGSRHGGLVDHVTSPLSIGADSGHGGWDGMLDDFVVYKRELSPSEIVRLFEVGKRRLPSSRECSRSRGRDSVDFGYGEEGGGPPAEAVE